MVALEEVSLPAPRLQKLTSHALGARMAKAEKLFTDREFERALEEYRSIAKLMADDAVILNNYGSSLAEIGRLDEAIAAYNRSLEIRPQNAETLYNRGLALANLHRDEEAARDLLIASAELPDRVDVIGLYAAVLAKLGKYAEATHALSHIREAHRTQRTEELRRAILDLQVRQMARRGILVIGRGKPRGSEPPVPITPGRLLSDVLVDERR